VARKSRRQGPQASSTAAQKQKWTGYGVVGLLCAALGSGGTYLALKPALSAAASSRTTAADAALTQANSYEDQQQWPLAIIAYKQAIAGGLDNPDIRTDLGVAYFRSQQPKLALEQYLVAQRQNPNHENSLYNQGSVYAVSGDSPRAISLWQDYLKRFPTGIHAAEAKTLITELQAHGVAPTPK
jgi:tetratricopeptide (TPR) repeat protein